MTIETLTQRVQVLEKQLLVLLDDKAPVKNSKKSKKDKADTPKVKRTSGYLQHNTARRAEVKARLEADGAEKSKATEVTKELAVVWKALSDDEREVWNAKANAVKEAWKSEAQAAVKHDVDEPELVEEEIEGEKPKKKEKKEKKVKKEKKEDKPKRVSGYILFQKAMRDDAVKTLNDALEEDGAKIKQSDVMKELGKMWKALDDDERKEWNDKAAEQKASDSEE